MVFPLDLLQPGAPNLGLLAIIGALGLAAAPHWYTIYLTEANKVNGGWSNVNPRAFVNQLATKTASGKKLTPLEAKILRGQSAQGMIYITHLGTKYSNQLDIAINTDTLILLAHLPPTANGFENAPLFGLVMLIGTYAKLPSHTLNRTAAFYLVGRIAFNYLYLTTTTKPNSYLRTIVFNSGVFALLRIIVLATYQINS
ncbi:unnamed protein product [Tilletia caries]|uniref:Uncharacterized protein n=2 Tax=Tilletia TaxID=13289 RepID=A0A8X7MV31_9BASI|nr:hypothetical protein CF335_g3078 [Tilletia laevis]KAE8246009.1 hypothetical protein A4X03_0g7357 [Tilletia caries]KAE8249377.1 hypothetical protein A4X06_0g3262 [Tilletia controversa]CAD6884277.1 unnamed protein product [Tilletia caries]CAD6967171.1 unnamed protein product [Tilletia controversa]